MDESLIRVDCLDLSFVFLGLVVKDLLLDLVRLLLAKVKWKPVCEPLFGDRGSHFVLCEGFQRQKVEGWVHVADFTGTRKPR